MPDRIERSSMLTDTFPVTNDPSTSSRIPFGSAAAGVMYVQSTDGNATDTVTWHLATTISGPAMPLVDALGTPVTQSIQPNKAYELPPSVYGALFLVPVTTNGPAQVFLSIKG
jgi:hypothetical protein